MKSDNLNPIIVALIWLTVGAITAAAFGGIFLVVWNFVLAPAFHAAQWGYGTAFILGVILVTCRLVGYGILSLSTGKKF